MEKTWKSTFRSSKGTTWYSATRFNSYLLLSTNLQFCSLKSAARISKIFPIWSWMGILMQTLSCSNIKQSFATTTPNLLRGLLHLHYSHKKPFIISSKAWSAHKPTTRAPSTGNTTCTARIVKMAWRVTFRAACAFWLTCFRPFEINLSMSSSWKQSTL